jgi:hypothetical protein
MSIYLDREAVDEHGAGLQHSNDFSSEEDSIPKSKMKRSRKNAGRPQPYLPFESKSSDSDNDAYGNSRPLAKRIDDGGTSAVMDELKKNSKLLESLVHRVKKTEKGLKSVQIQLKNNNSSDSTPGSTPKRPRNRDVPDEVRVRRLHS